MNIKLDANTIRSINAFERITGAEVRDCIIEGNSIYFVVEPGKVGLVIGKNGRTIKKVQETLNKKVRVFEYSEKLKDFVKNIVGASIEDVRKEGSVIFITFPKNKKPSIIGRDGKNIELIVRLLKRNFGITQVKI